MYHPGFFTSYLPFNSEELQYTLIRKIESCYL